MEIEKVTGFKKDGQYCISCNKFYDSSLFKQSVDLCYYCEKFREKSYYTEGKVLMKTIDGTSFRCFVPYILKISDNEIEQKIKNYLENDK